MAIDRGKISRVRREKVIRLAKIEVEREKRGRIENVLIQKLAAKHGQHTSRPIPRKVITQNVKSFLDGSNVVAEQTDIRNLTSIADEISRKLLSSESMSMETVVGATGTSIKPENKHIVFKANNIVRSSREKVPQQKSLSEASPWTLLDAFKEIETGEIALAEKSTTMKSKKDMAAALHKQIHLKESAKKERENEDQKFEQLQAQQLKEWQKMQENNVRLDREKSAQLRKVREEQIEELKKRRQLAFDNSRSRELKDIEKLKGMLDLEEQRKREQKEQERLRWKSIVEENNERKRQRQLKKEQEAAMDAKLMEDMKNKLDLEEAERAKVLAERMERNKAIGQQMTKAGAFKDREKMIEMERKIMQEAQERENKAIRRERCKQEAREQKKMQIMQENMKMADERMRREKELEQAQEEYSIQCRRETEAVKAEEEAQRAKRAATTKEYSRSLKNQIDEQRRQQTRLEDMTSVERSINKEILSKIENDPVIQQKIAEKIFRSPIRRNYKDSVIHAHA